MKKAYQLEKLEGSRIIEWSHGEGFAWLVLEVWEGGEKVVVLGTEGDLNLPALLRVKRQFRLAGVLVWEELTRVDLWVENSGLLGR